MACLLVTIVATFVAAPAAQGRRILLDGVAARVNESFITIGEVMAVVRELEPRYAEAVAPTDDARLGEVFQEALQDLIDRELVLQAYREGEGKIPPWIVDRRINEIVHERFGGDRAALRQALNEMRLDMTQWRQMVESQMILGAMRNAHAEQPAMVSPEMIRDHYRRHRGDFAEKEAVHIRMIVLRPADDSTESRDKLEARVREVMAELKSGSPFAAVASRYSEGRNADRGGDWGWVDPEADLRPELARAVAGLDPGRHSDPIRTPEELYLVSVEDRRKPRDRPLEEVWEDIHGQLRQSRARKFYNNWISRLRDDALIVTYELP